MLLSEFIERTSYHPTNEEWERITNEYMESDLQKDAWCKQWVKKSLLGASQRAVNLVQDLREEVAFEIRKREAAIYNRESQIKTIEYKHQREVERLNATIAELEQKLSRISRIISN